MSDFQRITILLKDSDEDNGYNKIILEYLNERHCEINNVGYAIAIEVVDDHNINDYIKRGILSTPALSIGDETQYGLNSIIATLAKLELAKAQPVVDKYSNNNNDGPSESWQEMAMKEMMSNDQEDSENISSSVKPKQQDYAEVPMSEKDIESRMSKYAHIYKARAERSNMGNPKGGRSSVKHTPAKALQKTTAQDNMEKLIANKGYDKAEAALLREIANNME